MKKELRKYAKALFQSILENNLTRCQHILEKVNDKAKKQIILELDDEGFMPIHIAAGVNHSRIVGDDVKDANAILSDGFLSDQESCHN